MFSTEAISISDPMLEKASEQIARDTNMWHLRTVNLEGWPEHQSNLSLHLSQFLHHRKKLVLENGIVFKGNHCTIQTSFLQEFFQNLHSSCVGLKSCLRKASYTVYWLGIIKQLKDIIGKCDLCCGQHAGQGHELVILTPQPDQPLEIVGVDLCRPNWWRYSSSEMATWRALVCVHPTRIKVPTLRNTMVWLWYSSLWS